MSLKKLSEMQPISKEGWKAVRAPINPYTRLAFGVLKKALKDLTAPDPLVALDALIWWLDEGRGWLIMLGIEPSEIYLKRLIRGCEHERTEIDRPAG